MTIFLLIRHGLNDMINSNILAGRAPGVRLNEQGRRQVAALADYLAYLPLKGVYSSPLERTLETAEPIARRQGLTVEVLPTLNEVDFGQWTGRSFDELSADPCWKAFNASRSRTRIPSGEIGLEVQLRMMLALETLCGKHGRGSVALVSHGDPIRAVIIHCLNMPLDAILRLEISPASISIVDFNCWHAPRVLCINSNGQGLPI